MTTARDIITNAMYDLNALQAGDSVGAADAAYAFAALNELLDLWSIEQLAIFCNRHDGFTLVPGQQNYPLGTGGTLNLSGATIPRPAYGGLNAAWVRDPNNLDIPVAQLDQLGWDAIPLKQQTNVYPTVAFFDPQVAQGVLRVWPIPTGTYQFWLEQMAVLAQFAALDDVVTLPPGYVTALRKNLALNLPGFRVAPDAALVMAAAEAKAAIKRLNTRIHSNATLNDFQTPGALGGQRAWNIFTNQPYPPRTS